MNESKIIIVTGAARGIGRAIASKLFKEGYYLILVDNDQNGVNSYNQAELSKSEFYSLDITSEDRVKLLFDDVIKKYGNIHAVVNNAGIIRDNMIWKMSSQDFDAVINVNVKGTWLMCREAAIIMKNQKYGSIVNIASRAWLGNPGQSNYSASKAAVVSMSRVLALELGRYNINVNAVAPGLIDTPLTQSLDKDVLNKLIEAQPTKTMGKPEDVANMVAFLVSEENRFITGQTIYVDGGKSIGAGI